MKSKSRFGNLRDFGEAFRPMANLKRFKDTKAIFFVTISFVFPFSVSI